MGLIEELLGCPLQQITRSYWAVKLTTGEWLCEARMKTDLRTASSRHFDWANDLVANGDVLRIAQLWLLCPPSKTSPLGNTARLDISEPGTAFQFKIATVDSTIAKTERSLQAHIIGRVDNKLTGECSCYIWDQAQDGLCTPETLIYDPLAPDHIRRDASGAPVFAGKTSIFAFHSWRPDLAPPGRLHLETLGVCV